MAKKIKPKHFLAKEGAKGNLKFLDADSRPTISWIEVAYPSRHEVMAIACDEIGFPRVISVMRD